jgi:hypothetical protein
MKVAIIGGLTKTERYLPEGKEWEYWGLNAIRPKFCDGLWSRWFNLHRMEHLGKWQKGLKLEVKWALDNPRIPFYVIGAEYWRKEIPHVREFPRPRLIERYDNYHSWSFDWMLCFAIALGAEEISLHGIGSMHAGEPLSARACTEFWCGYAEAKGIKVSFDPACDLFYQYQLVRSNILYGYEDAPPVISFIQRL